MGGKFKIRGLRHTGATQLLNAGCPAKWIQAILGHKKLKTTLIYACNHRLPYDQGSWKILFQPTKSKTGLQPGF